LNQTEEDSKCIITTHIHPEFLKAEIYLCREDAAVAPIAIREGKKKNVLGLS